MKNALKSFAHFFANPMLVPMPEQPTPAKKAAEPVAVHTGSQAKASKNLVRLHGQGVITLSPEDLDRHENVVIGDLTRQQQNREGNQMRRHFANPANRPLSATQHRKKHHNGCHNHGKFGNDLPMDHPWRNKTYNEAESRTPRELAAA